MLAAVSIKQLRPDFCLNSLPKCCSLVEISVNNERTENTLLRHQVSCVKTELQEMQILMTKHDTEDLEFSSQCIYTLRSQSLINTVTQQPKYGNKPLYANWICMCNLRHHPLQIFLFQLADSSLFSVCSGH